MADSKIKNDQTWNISLRELIDNPTGKGSAYVYARGAIRKGILTDFIELLRKYRTRFSAVPYIFPNQDVLFHVRVPSRDYSENKILYDVVFYLQYEEGKAMQSWNSQTYCNSPSFIFDYCYVYNKHDLIYSPLKSSLPREALTMPPVIRNPIESMGFERITQMAAHYLISGGCLNDNYVKRFGVQASDYNLYVLYDKVADPEKIIAVYQFAKYKQRKTHRKPLDNVTIKNREIEKREFHQDRRASIQAERKITKKEAASKRTARSKITAKKAKKSLLN